MARLYDTPAVESRRREMHSMKLVFSNVFAAIWQFSVSFSIFYSIVHFSVLFITIDNYAGRTAAAVIRSESPSSCDKGDPHECYRLLNSMEVLSGPIIPALFVCRTVPVVTVFYYSK